MTAKQVLEAIIREGLPPKGWGRWVVVDRKGRYDISALIPETSCPPTGDNETPLFWWGGINLANVPYWPEAFLPSPDDGVEPGEEMKHAERCLVGKLIGEAIKQLPDEDWEKFRDALLDLENSPEARLEAEIALNELYL